MISLSSYLSLLRLSLSYTLVAVGRKSSRQTTTSWCQAGWHKWLEFHMILVCQKDLRLLSQVRWVIEIRSVPEIRMEKLSDNAFIKPTAGINNYFGSSFWCFAYGWMNRITQKHRIGFAVIVTNQVCASSTLLSKHPYNFAPLFKFSTVISFEPFAAWMDDKSTHELHGDSLECFCRQQSRNP